MMKLNSTKLALTTGLSLAIISLAAVAEARIVGTSTKLNGQSSEQPQLPQQLQVIRLNSTKLNRRSSSKPQLPQQLKVLSGNGTKLNGQSGSKTLPSQHLKKLSQNTSDLTGQTSEPQPTQEIKGIETSP